MTRATYKSTLFALWTDSVRVFRSRPFYSVCSVRFDTDEFKPEDSRFGTELEFSAKKQAITCPIKGYLAM